MNKKGDINFVTLFGIVAGIFILTAAIYAGTKISGTQSYESNTNIAKQISVFIDPLQVGAATSSKGEINFGQKIMLKNTCENYTNFGSMEMAVSTLNTRKQYSDYGLPITINDKYIFTPEIIEDNGIYTLSRKFSFPFDVADFIVFIPMSTSYCFEYAPKDLANRIASLNLSNTFFYDCSDKENYINVCDNSKNCDIIITGHCLDTSCSSAYDYGFIQKNENIFYYMGDLIYPAIFSDYDNYICNYDRLMYKTKLVTELYSKKSAAMTLRGCVPNIDIGEWFTSVSEITDPEDALKIYSNSVTLNKQNSIAGCNLW